MSVEGDTIRVGVNGTGFIAQHVYRTFRQLPDLNTVCFFTRRQDPVLDGLAGARIVRSRDEFLEGCDVVLECSNDVVQATVLVAAALKRGLPVVTLDAGFHVTVGSAFHSKGRLTEAEGDQPGALFALHTEACSMGFIPAAYISVKGYLNHNPSRSEMERWARVQGISLQSVVAFTDGTKLHLEQALVANALGATLPGTSMHGREVTTLEEASRAFGEDAQRHDRPIVDFVLSARFPHAHGVFIVAQHDPTMADTFRYYKMGRGPYYPIVRHQIFTHLEIPRTIRKVFRGDWGLLTNSGAPRLGVAAVTKRGLHAGERLRTGYGSFDVRGEAVEIKREPDHVPICLIRDAVVRRNLPEGALMHWDDIEQPESAATNAWLEVRGRATTHGN